MSIVNDVRILPYTKAYQPHFERLNKYWIQKYFYLEDVDLAVLENPDQYIIDKGGHIIFVAVGEHIAGTVAFKKVDEETVEMIKLAVDEAYQGRRLGWALTEGILQAALDQGYKKMILYSNTKMVPAINMYQRIGFREVPAEPGKYERCTIKMEKTLEEENVHYLAASLLEKAISTSVPLLQQLTESAAAERPSADKWSPKEIIGHLIDSGINNNTRFVRAQQTPYLEMPAYEQAFWAKAQAWQFTGWQELINLWAGFNRHLALTIRAIPAEALQNVCKIGSNDPVTLHFLVTDYLEHLWHHLKQTKVITKDTI